MTKQRRDAVLERLDGLLAETEDGDRRREIREIQQLVIGMEDEGDDELDAGPLDED
jgi:hypothetical protein